MFEIIGIKKWKGEEVILDKGYTDIDEALEQIWEFENTLGEGWEVKVFDTIENRFR